MTGLSALYKKSETDVADHLKTVEGDDIDDALVVNIFKELDAEKVGVLKTNATTRFNDGIGKGQKDTAKKFEKKLRQVFAVSDDALEGDDLLTHIETEVVPELSKGGGGDKPDLSKVTEEDLAKIPAFITKQRDFTKQLKDKDKEKEDAVKAEQEKQTSSQILSEASAKAMSILDGKNPILPKDANKATVLKNKLLVDELKAHKFMKATDGSLIPLDAEGKQLNDANGNPVDFNSLVDGIIDANFEFNVAEPRKSPGSRTQHQQQQQDMKYTGKVPKNSAEYLDLLTDPDMDTEQKVLLKETYSEQFSD